MPPTNNLIFLYSYEVHQEVLYSDTSEGAQPMVAKILQRENEGGSDRKGVGEA